MKVDKREVKFIENYCRKNLEIKFYINIQRKIFLENNYEIKEKFRFII